MRYLNSPVGLNLVDSYIMKELPKWVTSGVVVNAGDGRMADALRAEFGGIKVYNVETREGLRNCIEDKDHLGKDPWDYKWYESIAKKEGGFDFIIFENIHEYWRNELYQLQQIFQLLRPDGIGFLNFYNSNSIVELGRNIPPFETGLERLANPMSSWANMDLTSWMIYLSDIGLVVNRIWGMLGAEAFMYCERGGKGEEKWKVQNLELPVKDIGDAFKLGAPVICLGFKKVNPKGGIVQPEFVGVTYNASMFQAILFPYAELMNKEVDLFKAKLEIDQKVYEEEGESKIFLDYYMQLIDEFEDIKKVLVVGCDWGADLLALKKLKPKWEIIGADPSAEVIQEGRAIMDEHKIKTVAYGKGGKLPFDDGAFDIVISLGHFSKIYHDFAVVLASEMLRVTKKGIVHFEDSRGPDVSMALKLYSIPTIYEKLGHTTVVKPIRIEEKDTGIYYLKVKK